MAKQKKKRYGIKCLSLLSVALLLGGIIIYALPETSVTNHIETGAVNIELDEYEIVNGVEQECKGEEKEVIIMPGTDISKIPRISNRGNTCYVRAKLTFSGTEQNLEDDVYGIPEGWVRCSDGYYYYEESLSKGDTVDLFQGILIPTDFPQTEEGKEIAFDIDVNAIQSRNFTPDFSSDAPWGTVEIKAYEGVGIYDISEVESVDSQTLKIAYQGDADNVFVSQDDFFTNFPLLLPGDEYSDSVTLANESKEDVNIYFRSITEHESELLKEVMVKITSEINGKTTNVYEGPLSNSEITNNFLLGTVKADTSGTLDFTITVPSELDNEYATISSYVRWIFSTEPITDTDNIQTGDGSKLGAWMIVAGVSLAVAIIFLKRRKRTGGRQDV